MALSDARKKTSLDSSSLLRRYTRFHPCITVAYISRSPALPMQTHLWNGSPRYINVWMHFRCPRSTDLIISCCWKVSFWVRGVKTFCTLSLLLAKVGSNQARRMLHRQESSFYKSPYLQSHATIEVNLTDDVAIARAFMPSANAMPFLQTAGSATWICRRSSRRPEEVPLEKKKTPVVPLSFSRYHFSDSPMLYCRGAALAWG